MIQYEINGQLYFAEGYQLYLENDLSYQVNDLEISIRNSSENNHLEVILKLISDNEESAIIRAGNELERISNLISWFYDIPIIKWKINGINFPGKKVTMTGIGTLSVKGCIEKTLDNEGIKNLNKQLTKSYDTDFEEILIMWRQALAEESKGLKFFLFYRVLEALFRNDRKKLDEFIKNKINNVEMRDDGRGKKVTIFTFLRDNIHAKGSKFPYDEIEQYLPQLQDLVRKKIQENFSSDLSI